MQHSLKDDILHITITGDLGSGKSTVAEKIAAALDLKVVSTGNLQRQIAAELNLSTLETNLLAEKDRAIDSKVDGMTAELAESATSSLIFDSRMAWHILAHSYRVRLLVDPDVAVRRVVSRAPNEVEAYHSTDDAQRRIRERYRSEVRRFIARYGVDITSLRHFDLVVDTSDIGPDEVAHLVVEGYRTYVPRAQDILVSPARIMPAFIWGPRRRARDEEINVIYSRPFFFAISGRELLERALKDRLPLIAVRVAAEGLELVTADVTALDFAETLADAAEMARWAEDHGLSLGALQRWIESATEDL